MTQSMFFCIWLYRFCTVFRRIVLLYCSIVLYIALHCILLYCSIVVFYCVIYRTALYSVVYYRRFGKCVHCCHGFAPDDLVREASGRLFHVDCFSCIICGRRIETGQEVLVIDDTTILCKDDCLRHGPMVTGNCNYCNNRGEIFTGNS